MTDETYKRVPTLFRIYRMTSDFVSIGWCLWAQLSIRVFLVSLGLVYLSKISAECSPGKCSSKFIAPKEESYNMYTFMSFSVPTRIWLELNEDLQKGRGAFVLNGLPNNSIKEFALRVAELRKIGVTVPIILDAKKVKKFDIKSVPATVIYTGRDYRMFSGAVRSSTFMRMSNKPENIREVKP